MTFILYVCNVYSHNKRKFVYIEYPFDMVNHIYLYCNTQFMR